MADLQADAGQWLSQSEAALRLGRKPQPAGAGRGAGRLQARKGNRGEWLVLVPAGLETEPEPSPGPAETELVAELREEMAELKHALGRAEGRAEALLQQVSGLAENLSAERTRA